MRLIRDCGEIERLIAAVESRTKAVEINDRDRDAQADEDCNNLHFLPKPDTSFFDHAVSWIGYESGLPLRRIK